MMLTLIVITLMLINLDYHSIYGYKYVPRRPLCQPITVPLCADVRYNLTRMPNLLGHVTQEEAAAHINEFIPLVQIGCSPLLKFFLCSQFAPMCTEQVDDTLIIPPCRALCLQVRSACEPVLLRFNFNWPASLDCQKLPEESTRQDLCIEPPEQDDYVGVDTSAKQFSPEIHGDRKTDEDNVPDTVNSEESLLQWSRVIESIRGENKSYTQKNSERVKCPEKHVYVENRDRCAPRCGADLRFRDNDKSFVTRWCLVWACLCSSTCIITLLTILIDTSRFTYPQRPVLYICLCSLVQASAYIIRAAVGYRGVACNTSSNHPGFMGVIKTDQLRSLAGLDIDAEISLVTGELSPADYLIQEGLESVLCTLVVILIYYSLMAGALWWVVLTLAWYLAAGRKWSAEALLQVSRYFHLAAWLLPAVQTIILLSLRWIEADELTGLCYAGSRDGKAVLWLVVAPLGLYVIVGFVMTLAGFTASLRIHRQLKVSGSQTGKLDRLTAKMATFSFLYALPLLCIVGCHLYEYHSQQIWQRNLQNQHKCLLSKSSDRTECSKKFTDPTPILEIYLMKVFMYLVTGINVSTWIWSCKTIMVWRNFLGDFLNKLCQSCGRKTNKKNRYSQKSSHAPANRVISVGTGSVGVPQAVTDRSANQSAAERQFSDKYVIRTVSGNLERK